jgi:serine/threonine-protein kinase RsbW
MIDAWDRKPCGERLVLSTRRDEIDAAEGRILSALDRCGFDGQARFAVRTALEEALANAVQHGNHNDPAKRLTVEYAADRSSVAIVVQDEGRGFDPAAVPDPTRPENVSIPSGRGIMIMRAYMSEVQFDPPGNRVRMTFRKP